MIFADRSHHSVVRCRRPIFSSLRCSWLESGLALHVIPYAPPFIVFRSRQKPFLSGHSFPRLLLLYRVAPKNWHNVLYALTLPNINRFSKFFHCQNQEKIWEITHTSTVSLHYLVSYKSTTTRCSSFKAKTCFLKYFTYLYIWCKNCRMWQLL